MDTVLNTLRSHLHTYRNIDDELTTLNAKAQSLRRELKTVESEMSGILAMPDFQKFEKLEIKDDGSMVKIQRPGTWSKGWTLSKNDLLDGLDLYFSIDSEPSAEECYLFLVNFQKPKMISNDFAFDRYIPKAVGKNIRK